MIVYCINKQKNVDLVNIFYDPRISRIEKIMSKICPKFLDLYGSIYGKFFSYLLLQLKYGLDT